MYFFKFYYAFLLPKCFIQYKLFSFQIQHIVYQIQYLFLETSTVSGDIWKSIISQPVLCISPNSPQRQTHSSAVLQTEPRTHGHWGWFVRKMKGACRYQVWKTSGYYSGFFRHLTLLACLVGNNSSSSV